MDENNEKYELERDREIQAQFAFFIERGFAYRYLYEKGGDSACVYIYRFQKGKGYFDVREVSGGDELGCVVFSHGNYLFPSLKSKYKKEHRAFALKHLFKKSGAKERRALLATLLQREYETTDFFGLK